MYLYSPKLQKNVFVAKIESDIGTTAASSTAIVWTEETGWHRVPLKYFEPPMQESEGKE